MHEAHVRNEDFEVGETVWYLVGNDRQEAEVLGGTGTTHLRIRLLTGPQAGTEIDCPGELLQRAPRSD